MNNDYNQLYYMIKNVMFSLVLKSLLKCELCPVSFVRKDEVFFILISFISILFLDFSFIVWKPEAFVNSILHCLTFQYAIRINIDLI